MHRRQFLSLLPASVALSPLPPRPRPGARTVALIGCGWYGKHDLMRLLQVAEVEVVGLCDVDQLHLREAERWVRARQPEARPRLYGRHEELLANERPELVLIATPDHWHARQALDAIAAGAHLYLQKPVANTRAECEAVLAAARQHERVVQVAMQRRSTPHLMAAKERFIDSGELGEVHHAEAFCYFHMRDPAVREVQPVPDFFDYERWTGPAPLLPFRGLPHRRWRAFTAYGNGILGDMCVHMLDLARWYLDLGEPERVTSTGGIYVQTRADATTTDTQHAVFTYPDRPLTFTWQHRSWGVPTEAGRPWGLNLHGANGMLKLDVWGWEWVPRNGEPEGGKAFVDPAYPEDKEEPGIELHQTAATRAHLRDWLACIESGRRPRGDIAEGVVSTGACIRAMEALRAGSQGKG